MTHGKAPAGLDPFGRVIVRLREGHQDIIDADLPPEMRALAEKLEHHLSADQQPTADGAAVIDGVPLEPQTE